MAELRCELFPEDLDACLAFYVGVLGFTVVRDDRPRDDYVALTRGSVRLGAARRGVGSRAGRRPPVGVELVLEVSDLGAAHSRVVSRNWPIDEDLRDRPWGLRDFRILDPDGYYWRITERS